MLYRSKTFRVLCPEIDMATRSETPDLTMSLIAVPLKSWKIFVRTFTSFSQERMTCFCEKSKVIGQSQSDKYERVFDALGGVVNESRVQTMAKIAKALGGSIEDSIK